MRRISPTELKDYLQRCDIPPLLIDVRESWEYEICQLEHSILIPMGQLFSGLAEVEEMKQLDHTKEIVLICHHGIRSYQAGLFLKSRGFDRIINLEGGVERWAQEIDPNMAQY